MKKQIIITLLVVLVLMGCNSEVVPASNEAEGKEKEVISAETEVIRGQLEDQVNELYKELEIINRAPVSETILSMHNKCIPKMPHLETPTVSRCGFNMFMENAK